MLACRQVVGHIGRASSGVSKRSLATGNAPQLTDFEASFDEPPQSPARNEVPLDRIVSGLAPPATVKWPNLPPTKDTRTLAREIRAHIAAKNVEAALAILSSVPEPHSRLLEHAAVHALLRISENRRAGAMLLAFATPHAMVKLPRMHPTTLSRTILALLSLIPKAQGAHEWIRTAMRPTLMFLNHNTVSDAALRTALALWIQARKLFVPRPKQTTAVLWKTLLAQREWIPAALMFDLQVKDYQLRKTLPTLLRDPDAPPLTPHDRQNLRRRLAVLRVEQIRGSRPLFAELCYRIAGVIANVTSRPESGFMSPAVVAAHRRAAAAQQSEPDDDETYSIRSTRFRDNDPDEAYKQQDSDRNEAYPRGFGAPPKKKIIRPNRAFHHVRVALQALSILGGLIDSRQIAFPDISAWISAVGSLPPSVSSVPVFTLLPDGPKRVHGREYLRTVLETYASALPRVPHLYSELPFGESGWLRRGLKHKHTILSSTVVNEMAITDPSLRTSDASPTQLEGYLGAVELDGLSKQDRKKRTLRALRQAWAESTVHQGEPDAEDEGEVPRKAHALLDVLMHGEKSRGLLYESMPSTTTPTAEAARLTRATDDAKAADSTELRDYNGPEVEERKIVHQHYHAPDSPNNPHPHVAYPAHPLDFEAYPTVALPSESEPKSEPARPEAALAARVVEHMMHARSPPLQPWESDLLMSLLERRVHTLGEEEVWDEVWAGARRSNQEEQMRRSEAQRIIERENRGLEHGHRVRWGDREEEGWALDHRLFDVEAEEVNVFTERLTRPRPRQPRRDWDDDQTYYDSAY
ncbi:hypothetical protein DFH09DRAFT_1160181 [Mycena vulgaris]|nr:hypothetical protein DFH09DRAFT_1160181 [Mycena vulgaris]